MLQTLTALPSQILGRYNLLVASPQLAGPNRVARQNIHLATISRNHRGRRSVRNSFTPLILTPEKDRPQDIVVVKTGCSMVRKNLFTLGTTCVCRTFVMLIQTGLFSSIMKKTSLLRRLQALLDATHTIV